MIYLQSILALLFVLGLIGALYLLLQQWGGRIPGVKTKQIRVIESVSLGEKRNLFLVEVQNECFLLAATGHHISLLSTVEPSKETADVESQRKPTMARLKKLRLRHSETE